MIDSTNSLAYMPYKHKLSDDVTEVVTVDQAGCQCEKAPPHCDCCAQFKMFGFPVKGNDLSPYLSCVDFHNHGQVEE